MWASGIELRQSYLVAILELDPTTSLFKILILFHRCMNFCLYVCIYTTQVYSVRMFCLLHTCICTTYVCGALRGQRRESDSLEPELSITERHYVGAGNQTRVLYKNKCALLMTNLSTIF